MFRLLALGISFLTVALSLPTYEEWTTKYNKPFDDAKKTVYNANVAKINEHNAHESSYTLGVNQYTDMTFDEFSSVVLMPNRTAGDVVSQRASNKRNIDWRLNGYVQEVNDQGYCGSCWAFSAAETLSARYRFVHRNNGYVLSPQELVDCVPESYHCYGCGGGWADRAMEYALKYLHGGLEQWRTYPYVGQDQKCNLTAINSTINVNGSKVNVVKKGNQTDLLNALYTYGPLSVCIYVDDDFMLYKSGIYSSKTCPTNTTNHCVLLYGLYYDATARKWAYMVRNSWGADSADQDFGFGVDGDIFMDADIANGNLCAIASFASYVT